MNIFVCLLALLSMAQAYAQTAPDTDSKAALELIVQASRQTDYADYRRLAGILGFDIRKVEARVVPMPMPSDPNATVSETHVEFMRTPRTAVSSALVNAHFNMYIPSTTNIANRSFSFVIDTNKVCVTKDQFAESFTSLTPVPTTDAAGLSFGQKISGPGSRMIRASFDIKGCTGLFTFFATRSPSSSERHE